MLHLILDEHIGPAGLRAAGRTDDAVRLSRFLEGEGFLVFDAAYSQHHITVPSHSHVLNFVSGRFEKELVDEESSLSKNRLLRSRYFAALTKAGYAIDVYQPTGSLALGRPEQGGHNRFNIHARAPGA